MYFYPLEKLSAENKRIKLETENSEIKLSKTKEETINYY